jgi:hypothetical protein
MRNPQKCLDALGVFDRLLSAGNMLPQFWNNNFNESKRQKGGEQNRNNSKTVHPIDAKPGLEHGPGLT